MGLLNKLKNAIFEEEEVEVNQPVEEKEIEKTVSRPQSKPIKKKEPVKMTFESDEDAIMSDRELFKAEPTFNFPAFDEEEFQDVKKEETRRVAPSKKDLDQTMEVKPRTPAPTVLDMERRTRVEKEAPKRNYNYKDERKAKEVSQKPVVENHFVPSPVISPVYGVLDKNYKKEDIVVKAEEEKKIDVDSVRKKAFGTLEEDIEKTLNTSTRDFYKKEKKDVRSMYREDAHRIDELLKEASEDEISVSEKEETILEKPSFNIDEESVRYRKQRNAELEQLDRPRAKKPVEEKLEDETLENDLFDLIDSMYETREDGE